METTQEKTMENEMQAESMSMDDSMTEMEAAPKSMDKMPECAIVGLIKNHKLMLEESLQDAKLRFAEASLDEDNWSGKYERKTECKIIEGQMSILTKLLNDFECMFTPQPAMQ